MTKLSKDTSIFFRYNMTDNCYNLYVISLNVLYKHKTYDQKWTDSNMIIHYKDIYKYTIDFAKSLQRDFERVTSYNNLLNDKERINNIIYNHNDNDKSKVDFKINAKDIFIFAYKACDQYFIDKLIKEMKTLDYTRQNITDEVCSNISSMGGFDLSYKGLNLKHKATFIVIDTIYRCVKADIVNKFNIDEKQYKYEQSMSINDDLWSDENTDIKKLRTSKIYISTRLIEYMRTVDSNLTEKYLKLSFIAEQKETVHN